MSWDRLMGVGNEDLELCGKWEPKEGLMRLSIMLEDKDASFLGLIYFSLFNFAEGVGARVEAINSAGMLLYFFFLLLFL